MKIAIVGAAPSSRGLAPFGESSWEIWGCSPSNAKLPRVSAWFELHALADLGSERWSGWTAPYFAFLNGLACPIYMQAANDHVPKAVAFPKAEVIERFGPDFLTSSIAWMMAKAIMDGAEGIGVWGVDMTTDQEYEYQRPGVQYFIKTARSLGIAVTIPPQSDLAAPMPLYGFGDADPNVVKLKTHAFELMARIGGLDREIADLSHRRGQLIEERAHLRGALEQNIYTRRNLLGAWSGPDE